MLLNASDRLWYSLRMSVLSRLAASGVSSLRWSPLDTTSGLSAWALGRSEALKGENDGGLWPTARASENGNYQRDRGDPSKPRATQMGAVLVAESMHTGQWPTGNAADSERGPESRATKQARGAGGINQPEAVRLAHWQTPTAQEFDSRRQVGDTKRQPLLVGQVKAAAWQTPTAADGGSTSRGGDRIGEMLLGGQVRAANWQTCVVMDKEQSGSSARGPTQTSQVRGSEWATPNTRDYKDTGTTQGNRKSPNLGTQCNQADGRTSSG